MQLLHGGAFGDHCQRFAPEDLFVGDGVFFVGAQTITCFLEQGLFHFHAAAKAPAICRDFKHEVCLFDGFGEVGGEDRGCEGIECFLAFAFHYDDFGTESVRLGVARGACFAFIGYGSVERDPLIRAASERVMRVFFLDSNIKGGCIGFWWVSERFVDIKGNKGQKKIFAAADRRFPTPAVVTQWVFDQPDAVNK